MEVDEAQAAADEHLERGDVIGATVHMARAVEAAEAAGDEALAGALRAQLGELAGREVPPFGSNEDYLLGEVRYLYHLLQALLAEDRAEGREQASGSLEQLAVSDREAHASIRRAGPPTPAAPDGAWDNARVLRALLDQRLMAAMREAAFEIPVATLTQQFGLSDIDWMILLVVLAPAVEPDILRVYRKCWKDFTRRRPDVWFVARLLDRDPAARRAIMRRLTPEAPLVRHGLVTVLGVDGQAAELLPFRELALPSSVADRLLGHVGMDPALVGRARLWHPGADQGPLSPYAEQLAAAERLRAIVAGELPTRVAVLVGPRGSGRRTAIQTVARALGRPVLSVQLRSGHGEDASAIARAAGRDAMLHGAVLHLELEEVGEAAPDALENMGRAIYAESARGDQPIVLTCGQFTPALARELPDAMVSNLVAPTLEEQVRHWHGAIARVGLAAPADRVLREAGCRQGLTPRAIEASAAALRSELAEGGAAPTAESLRKTVRLQLQSELGAIARHLGTRLTWTDIVLPDETIGRLMDIVTYARYRDEVFDRWGFGEKYQRGQGMIALLSGASGTGKSTVAALLAREIGVDIYQVDLSRLVSKWIGETEKNLARIFDEAERIGAALLFDEADSVFGKRTKQSNSTDRYANMETNYLLQRVEDAQTLIVLTTNYPENMDEAFMRRILFDVKFPFPDFADRERLWRAQLPRQAKLAQDVKLEWLAAEYELAGGRIRNAVLNAAFRAAERDGVITMADLEEAAQREYRAMGRLVRTQPRETHGPVR